MKNVFQVLRALCILAIGVVVLPAGTASAAAKIQTRAPCTNGGDTCFNFGVGITGVGNFDLN